MSLGKINGARRLLTKALARHTTVQTGLLLGISKWYESEKENKVIAVPMSLHIRDVYVLGLHTERCGHFFPPT